MDRPAVCIEIWTASTTEFLASSSLYRLMSNRAKSILNANPSIGIMFITKMDKSIVSLNKVITPNAETTVTIPIASGIKAATTLPNARSNTTIAIGKPIASALAKSFWLALLISLLIAAPPPVKRTPFSPSIDRGCHQLHLSCGIRVEVKHGICYMIFI